MGYSGPDFARRACPGHEPVGSRDPIPVERR